MCMYTHPCIHTYRCRVRQDFARPRDWRRWLEARPQACTFYISLSLSLSMYIYIYIYMCTYMCIYIYIYIYICMYIFVGVSFHRAQIVRIRPARSKLKDGRTRAKRESKLPAGRWTGLLPSRSARRTRKHTHRKGEYGWKKTSPPLNSAASRIQSPGLRRLSQGFPHRLLRHSSWRHVCCSLRLDDVC